MCELEDEKKGSDMETVDWMIWGLTFCCDFGSMFVQTRTSPTRIASVRSCFAMKSRVERFPFINYKTNLFVLQGYFMSHLTMKSVNYM